MFIVNKTRLQGCYEIQPSIFEDKRGHFVKIFNFDAFVKAGLETNFKEEYYTQSIKGVIRGMHFQTPPAEHTKLVYCVHGEVLDVILDLRKGSPTYGISESIILSSKKANYLYIPKGVAHGFVSMCDMATLVYKVSTVYSPQNDSGILWNSFGFNWPLDDPIISERDVNFPSFAEYQSPFIYE